jgi:hypothetical protein
MLKPNESFELDAFTITSSIDADELFGDVVDIDEVDEEDKADGADIDTEKTDIDESDNEKDGEVKVTEEQNNDSDSDDDDFELTEDDKEAVHDELVEKMADDMENEESEEEVEEEPEESYPKISSITGLGRVLRNDGFKLSVFNIKDTLIRYLEMFGERKIARHVLDQDSHTFYEIHAVYMPGAVVFKMLSKLGFKPLHPTDLDENYPKDMRYEVAMTNGDLAINVFGGLQQHAPTEETVIRNLYDWEKKRYNVGVVAAASSTITASNNQYEIAKNLVLAALQSRSLNRNEMSEEFMSQAMASDGIDAFIDSLASPSSFERQPSYVEISDESDFENQDDENVTDNERIEALEPKDSGDLFKYEE